MELQPGAQTALALWINRATGDTCLLVMNSSAAVPTVMGIGFDTEFSIGTRVQTLSRENSAGLSELPGVHQVTIDWLNDVQQLYQIHRARVERLSPVEAAVKSPGAGEELETLQRDMEETMKHQVKVGRFYVDGQRESYRPTMRGACLMTWGHMFSMVRTLIVRGKAKRELRAMGLDIPIHSPKDSATE